MGCAGEAGPGAGDLKLVVHIHLFRDPDYVIGVRMTEKYIFRSVGKLRPHMTELTHFLGVLIHALEFWKKLSGV